MFISITPSGQITGIYQVRQTDTDIEVSKEALQAFPFPRWDKGNKRLINDSAAEADALERAQTESAYEYARNRAQAYTREFSKDPRPNPVDALGHVVDAILSHISGDPAPLEAILQKRATIKAENPKP